MMIPLTTYDFVLYQHSSTKYMFKTLIVLNIYMLVQISEIRDTICVSLVILSITSIKYLLYIHANYLFFYNFHRSMIILVCSFGSNKLNTITTYTTTTVVTLNKSRQEVVYAGFDKTCDNSDNMVPK